MLKVSMALTVMGLLAILSSALYPLGMMGKQTFLIMLIGGALVMFIGSIVRTYAILRKK